MSELANLHVSLTADTVSLVKGLDAAVRATEGFTDKLDRIGLGLKDMGRGLTTAVTDPLKNLATASAKAAIDFESAFAGVRKTVDATEPEFAALEKGIRDMAKAIPASATEIAGVAEAAGQLGIKKEAILGFTRTMIDLGNSTNMTADTAATQLARLANITQMPQTEFGRLGSTVVALGNNLATTEGEIVSMGLRLAGAGKQVGMTEAQVLGFAGALSSVGIQAESGGSAFSTVFKKIQTSVLTGNKDLQSFASVAGMSVAQFKQAFEKDASSAIVSFTEGLGGISKAGGNTIGVLDALGFSDLQVSDALLRASNSGDLFRRSLEIGSKAWAENTALTKEAEQRYKTMKSQLAVVGNQLMDAAITIGNDMMPMVKALANGGTSVAQAFQLVPAPMRQTILVIGGVAAAIGPLLMVTGSLIVAWGTVSTAAVAMSAKMTTTVIPAMGRVAASFGTAVAAAAPWLLAAAAVGAAAIPIIKNWDILSQEFQVIWNNLSAGVASFYDTFKEAFSKVGTIVQKVAGYLGEKLGPVFDLLPDGAKRALEGTGAALGGLPDLIPAPVKAMAAGVGGALVDTGEFIKFAVSQYAQDVKDVFGGMAAEAPKLVESMAAGIVQPVEAATTTINALGNEAAKALGDSIADGGKKAEKALKAFEKELKASLKRGEKAMQSFGKRLDVFTDLGTELKTTEANFKVFGKEVDRNEGIARSYEKAAKSLISMGLDPMNPIVQKLRDRWKDYTDAAKEAERATRIDQTFADVGKAMDVAAVKAQVFGKSFDLTGERSRVLEGALNKLIEDGVSPTDERFKELQATLEATRSPMDGFKASATEITSAVSGMRDGLKTIGETLGIEVENAFIEGAVKAGNFALAVVQVASSAQTLVPALMTMGANFMSMGQTVLAALPGLSAYAATLWGTVIPAMTTWAATTVAATWPILAVAAAVGVVVAAVIWLGDSIIQSLGGAQQAWDLFVEGITFMSWVIVESMKQLGQAIGSGLASVVKGAWDGVLGFIRGQINGVIGLVNFMIRALNAVKFTAPDWVPHIGGMGWQGPQIPEIPMLAKGGIATAATAAVVGEGAHPEAILPLSTPNLSYLGDIIGQYARGGQQPAYAGGGATVTNYLEFHYHGDGSRADGEEQMERFFHIARRKGLIK